jgi:hypothetical protein
MARTAKAVLPLGRDRPAAARNPDLPELYQIGHADSHIQLLHLDSNAPLLGQAAHDAALRSIMIRQFTHVTSVKKSDSGRIMLPKQFYGFSHNHHHGSSSCGGVATRGGDHRGEQQPQQQQSQQQLRLYS